ncbi:sialin-like [Dendronephthya gigantea]|uniref:sialin-like n=1 Tax=Dendronephthya gigantea TaxID=151771 RepID=UPI00106B97AD|nr:sialin-like [Dendronephthya gigantea]
MEEGSKKSDIMEQKEEQFPMTERRSQTDNDDQQDIKDTLMQNLVDSTNQFSWEDQGCLCSFIPKRYMVTFLAMFGFFNAYALRVNLSVAMVAMVNNVTKFGHGLETEDVAEFNWNTNLQGLILSSFFFGYITTQIPGGFLASKYGGKNLFGGGILIASILTMLTPVATRRSVSWLIALRVLEGIAQGVIYSSNHAVMSRWAPILERSKMVALTNSGSFIGTVFAMPVSGILVKMYGWPAVFYFFGFLGILWSFLWFFMVTNSPNEHQKISKKELNYIEKSLKGESETLDCKVPWKSILLSTPVWAIVAAHFCQNWGYYTLLTTLPTYMKAVLGIELLATGFLAALPYLAMTVVLHFSGFTSDFIIAKKVCSTTSVRKVSVCTGFLLQAIFTAAVGYTTSKNIAVVFLTLGVGIGGLIWCGFSVNMIDIGPRYAGLLMGISNCVATLPGIIGPSIAGALTPNETLDEWRTVFYISGGVSLLGCIAFGILASGKRQEWNENEYNMIPTSPVNSPD